MQQLETIIKNNTATQILGDFLQQQLKNWELANNNYDALKNVEEKTFWFDSFQLRAQFNPARITSATAKVDSQSIQKRACFLCENNRPLEQQAIAYADNFYILVNPFPIIQQHFTLVKRQHQEQLFMPNFIDFIGMAKLMEGYTLFYNGAKCGASAPDHMHFQAGNSGFMPIDTEYEQLKKSNSTILKTVGNAEIKSFNNYLRKQISIEADNSTDLTKAVKLAYNCFAELQPEHTEPMLNVIANFNDGKYTVHLFPRRLHRPTQYFEEGDKQLLISPGAVDFGGVFSTPRQEDFNKVTATDLVDIFNQICVTDIFFESLCDKINSVRL